MPKNINLKKYLAKDCHGDSNPSIILVAYNLAFSNFEHKKNIYSVLLILF